VWRKQEVLFAFFCFLLTVLSLTLSTGDHVLVEDKQDAQVFAPGKVVDVILELGQPPKYSVLLHDGCVTVIKRQKENPASPPLLFSISCMSDDTLLGLFWLAGKSGGVRRQRW
jgi:hypothetical protein